jgi:Helix-turn-helix domain
MYITVKQLASTLKISETRVRVLLAQGRIIGAYKHGGVWMIPLVDGKPPTTPGKRGPQLSWKKARLKALAKIHVDAKAIKDNLRSQSVSFTQSQSVGKAQSPQNNKKSEVITIKHGKENTRCYGVEINGPCRIVYSPNAPLKRGGARVWIETYAEFEAVYSL